MTTAIILAGGLGTRLRSTVPDVPKPMAPINNQPFLEYQLNFWHQQGIKRFVLAVGYKYASIMEHFGNNYKDSCIEYVVEPQPLGTGGALLLAASTVTDSSFLLLNGDTYFAVNLEQLRLFAEQHNADWCLALATVEDASRYTSISISASGEITTSLQPTCRALGAASMAPADKLRDVGLGQDTNFGRDVSFNVNGGVYWVQQRALLDYKSSFATAPTAISLENDILPQALALKRRVFGFVSSATFIDIGIPADYYKAAILLKKEFYESYYSTQKEFN